MVLLSHTTAVRHKHRNKTPLGNEACLSSQLGAAERSTLCLPHVSSGPHTDGKTHGLQ